MALQLSVQTYGKRDGMGFDARDLVKNFAAYTGRKNRSEDAIDKMAQSFLRVGQEQNFLYRKGFNGEPIPVTGHTRILAAARITERGMKSVSGVEYSPDNPFIIYGTFKKMNAVDALFHTFAENDDETRTAMNDVDIALFIATAKETASLSNKQLSEKLGKSIGWIAQHERVLEMEPELQNGIASGDIKLSAALAASDVDPADRPAVIEKARKDHRSGQVTASGVAQAARDLGATTKATSRMAPKWNKAAVCAKLQEYADMDLPPHLTEMTPENAVRTVLVQIMDEIQCGEV